MDALDMKFVEDEASALVSNGIKGYPFPEAGTRLHTDMLRILEASDPNVQRYVQMAFERGMKRWYEAISEIAAAYGALGIRLHDLTPKQNPFIDKLFAVDGDD